MKNKIVRFVEYLENELKKEKDPLQQAKILQAILDLKKIVNKN